MDASSVVSWQPRGDDESCSANWKPAVVQLTYARACVLRAAAVLILMLIWGCDPSAAWAKRGARPAAPSVLPLGDDLLRLQPEVLVFVDAGRTLAAGDLRATRYVDVETGRQLRTGPPATLLAPSPDGQQMFAAIRPSPEPAATPTAIDTNYTPQTALSLIDPATGRVTRQVWLPCCAPVDVRWAEDGKAIWLHWEHEERLVALAALLAKPVCPPPPKGTPFRFVCGPFSKKGWDAPAIDPYRDFALPFVTKASHGRQQRRANVAATARSPSGKRVALELMGGGVLVYDAPDLQHPRRFDWPGTGNNGGNEIPHRLAFVDEDRLVHATGVDVEFPEPSLRLFDLRSGAVIRTLPSRPHDHVTISPNGRVLVTWGSSTGVQLWDVEAGTERLPHTGHRGGITAMAFTFDGTQVVTGAADGTVRVWDARTGAQQRVLPVGLAIDALALDRDGRVAVCSFSHVQVWRLADGVRAFASHLQGSNGNDLTIAFTRDGDAVEYNNWSGNPVHRWDLARDVTTTRDDPMLKRLQELSFHADDEVSADRQRALTAESGVVVLRELPSGKEIVRVAAAGTYLAKAIAPDSKAFAVGEPHGKITWIAGARRRELRPFGDARITALAFSLDGRTLACGAADGRVVLWRPGD